MPRRVAVQAAVLAASLMSAAAFILHWPCRNSGYVSGRFTSMCYSDLAAYFANPPLAIGDFPFSNSSSLNAPPLGGIFLWLISLLSSEFITSVVITQIGIVVAFFVVIGATIYQRPWSPIDAAFIASMPLWPFVIFVSTDLYAISFAAVSLAMWSRSRFTAAGFAAGFALLSGGWTWIVIAAFIVDAARSERLRDARATFGVAAVVTIVGQLPLFITGASVFRLSSDASDGGVFHVLNVLGITSVNFNGVLTLLGGVIIVVVARWAYALPFDFRVEALILLFVVIQLVTSPSIPPQTLTRVAWLIPLVFVNKKHMFSYSAIFIFYIGAVWLRLEGTIDGGKGAPDQAYAIATIGLWGACAWLMVQCVDIMRIQGRDTVRQSLARYARENDSHYAE